MDIRLVSMISERTFAASFSEEHRATLDWLNEITDDRFAFFGVEIELLRIGNSQIAPRFNVIAKPNNWSKSVAEGAARIAEGELTETRQLQLRYWVDFRQFLIDRKHVVHSQKPKPQHWMYFSVGRSDFKLVGTVNTRDDRYGVELFIRGDRAKGFFSLLKSQKDEIESIIGHTLDWQELPNRQGCRIALYKDGCVLRETSQWPQQMMWMSDTLSRFHAAFHSRVRVLDAGAAQIFS